MRRVTWFEWGDTGEWLVAQLDDHLSILSLESWGTAMYYRGECLSAIKPIIAGGRLFAPA